MICLRDLPYNVALTAFRQLLFLLPPPLLTQARFPQCSASSTTKMADAMEEYEKEAGCVPILHPEVWHLDSAPRTDTSSRTNYVTPVRAWVAVCFLSCFVRNSDAPCTTIGGGGRQVANNAKAANASPLLLLHSQ